MEQNLNPAGMLEKIMSPAFLVADEVVVQANQAALQRQVTVGSRIAELIAVGIEDYSQFTDGRLCVTLCIGDILYNATVTKAGTHDIFYLESNYEDPELRAFALAAQYLRGPLSNAMNGIDQLLPETSVQENEPIREQVAIVNRSLQQILRAVCNMSDTAHYRYRGATNLQPRDAVIVMEEIFERAATLVSATGKTLTFSAPQHSVFCLLDAEKLERAVLNLISNAFKFSPKSNTVRAKLIHNNNQLSLSIENDIQGMPSQQRIDPFSRFLREPGIEDGRHGIGLGMDIVRSVASAHGGTVLVQYPENAGIRITMTIAVKKYDGETIDSPIRLLGDYAGGRNLSLLELSDILPGDVFKEPY